MPNTTLPDDGLDTCYQMTEAAPTRRPALASVATLLRGAGYAVLIAGALGVGLLAMQPGGLALDEWLVGRPAMQASPAGACCSQLKLEIPNAMPPSESPVPARERSLDQFAGEDVPSSRTTDL